MKWSNVKNALTSAYLIFIFITLGFINFFIFDVGINEIGVQAVTIYVDSQGGGDYTTIQAAIDNANPGDTINVANETYNESVTVNKANITLIGNSTTNCKIIHHYIGTDSFNDYAAGINITAPGVKITEFNISVTGSYTFGIHLNPFSFHSNITNNKISSNGDGIFLFQSSNNTLTNNIIISSRHGINLQQSSNNNQLINNVIILKGFGHGIYIFNSSNINLIQNQIQIYREDYSGIFLSDTTYAYLNNNKFNNCNIRISGNLLKQWDTHNIDTSNTINGNPIYYYSNTSNLIIPSNAIQVIMANCSNMRISNHNFDTYGVQMAFTENSIINNSQFNDCGIYLYFSNNNTVNGNTISTNWKDDYSIYLRMANNNNLSENIINTHSTSYSICFSHSLNNNFVGNTVSITANGGSGIYLSQSSNNYLIGNQINMLAKFGYTISLMSSSYNNLINNKITGNNWGIYGISLSYSSDNNLEDNIIKTEIGIYSSHSSDNKLKDNIIITTDRGIYLSHSSHNNILTENNIDTKYENSHGVYIVNSNNNTLINCIITTTGSSAHGIYIDGKFATIINTTISSNKSVNSYDIYIINKGEIIAIKNCKFNTIQLTNDNGGVLNFKNYLGIQVYHDDGITPISGVDVEVKVNGNQLYASSGYGSTDDTTNASGKIDPLLITYRSYEYSNYKPKENVISVKVNKLMDINWERMRLNVDMTTSHTEFFYYDLTPPSTPTSLKVNRIPGTNTLNISWDLNLDTVNYALYSNKTGQWNIISNTTHPQNWTLDKNLQDCIWYYYRIQAWDKGELFSDLSEIVCYYLNDITPPITPTGLSAKPVPGGDALNISWDINPDNTLSYDIVWKDPINDEWLWLNNVTHPKNWYILSNKSLINGTICYFKIRACYKDIFPSNYSAAMSVVHRDYLAPEAPSNLKAEASSQNEIKLIWTSSDSKDVKGYRIYINQSWIVSNGSYMFLNEVDKKNLSYVITDLVENTPYYFVVTAFDEANNTSPYTEEVRCTTIGIPEVIATIPSQNSTGVAVNSSVTIIFNVPMNILTVEKVLDISPVIQYNLSWLKNNTELQIDFLKNLSYNSSYIIIIGIAKSETGLILENYPFILQFRTIEEKKIKPQIFKITILCPKNGIIVKPGEKIEISGTSIGFKDGTIISITLDEIIKSGTIDINGNWSVSIKVPEIEGNYSIRVSVGNINNSVYIIVKTDDEMPDEDDNAKKDKGFFEKNIMLILTVIIIILIIVVMVFIMIKKKSSKKVQKDRNRKEKTEKEDILYEEE